MTSAYGDLLASEDVRQAAIGHLQKWGPSYLAEVARRRDLDALPMWRGYSVESTGDAYPVAVVTAASTMGDPERTGQGPVAASWLLGIASVVAAPTRDEASRLGAFYGAAVRGMFVQHPGLSGFARGCTWKSESSEEVSWDDTKAVVADVLYFVVDVPNVVDSTGGLKEPPADPSAEVSKLTPTNLVLAVGSI